MDDETQSSRWFERTKRTDRFISIGMWVSI